MGVLVHTQRMNTMICIELMRVLSIKYVCQFLVTIAVTRMNGDPSFAVCIWV